ncbi:MAG: hypothetical protein Q8M29_04950 [Bacteroidota bacterium]|nr:hypothetical protein [Bacteroidota bacterium]
MLDGKQPLDYEKAVFITENAYHGNKYTYVEFKEGIDFMQKYVQGMTDYFLIGNNIKTNKNILVSKDSAAVNCKNAVYNYSIFSFITDSSFSFVDSTMYVHDPYTYSNKDPLASNTWENSQVLYLISGENQTGNCNALTSLFKILSLRLNSNANICTTQGHIFITHLNENGISFNVELASKAFPGTGSIETITHTSDEASRNGIAMRELDLKQSIGLCLINLAKGYQHKFNLKADNFMLQCAELALKYDSLNLNAMLLKVEVLEEILLSQNKPFEQTKKSKEFLSYQEYIKGLYQLGYREMPTDMKNQIIAAITKDSTYIASNKDNTYYPFLNIDKDYKRSASLSNGLFEEVDIVKPQEKYFRTVFDTKTKKIIGFAPVEKLYKDYYFDPVAFAWNIDPFFAKYPYQSPYAFVGNSPIMNVEFDGRDYGVYVNHDTKTVIIKATYYTPKGDANSHTSAVEATQFWNEQSGKYQYKVGKGSDAVFYDVKFELNVIEVDDPKTVASNDRVTFDGQAPKVTPDASSNVYQVLPDADKSFANNNEGENTSGYTAQGVVVAVKDSKKSTKTGAHEIGHTLGLKHFFKGIMTSASNDPNRTDNTNPRTVRGIFKNAFKHKGSAGIGTVHEEGTAPKEGNFSKGKIVDKPVVKP